MMKKNILFCLFIYSLFIIGQSDQVFIIKGKVTDQYTKKPMKNVNLFYGEYGTITNKKGAYTLDEATELNKAVKVFVSNKTE